VALGMFICNGACTARLFMEGAVADKIFMVHPESSIAVPFMDANSVGGVQSKVKVN
jgi:hypothetical protein